MKSKNTLMNFLLSLKKMENNINNNNINLISSPFFSTNMSINTITSLMDSSSYYLNEYDDFRDDGKGKELVFEVGSCSHEEEGMKKSEGNNKEKKVKKHRFAFHTRSNVDILDDGYRWRKYGQKAVKNNKFPRSYYRCTQSGCNVKKQVQRLTKDEGVVVTTYEGVHTHPIERSTDTFDNILKQMHIYVPP